MAKQVHVEQRDNVLIATLDHPPHALLTFGMLSGLADLAQRADEDPDIGGVVVTGAHPTRFLAHYDVAQILRSAEASPHLPPGRIRAALRAVGTAGKVPGSDPVLRRSPAAGLVAIESLRELLLAIGRCSAVWVAAINGDAAGGGVELALACDVRYMAEGDFRLAQPEVFLGFPPGAGGTQRLARLVGTSRALRICLDGGPVSPAAAHEIGLVDRVVPPDDLLDAAVAEASRLGRRPKAAIGAIKRSVIEGSSLPLVDGLRLEAAEFLSAATTPESLTAQRAYLQRTDELGDLPVAVPDEVERIYEAGRFS